MSGVFGGGGGQTVNTIQQSDPWSGVQPYLKDLFGRSQDLSNREPFSFTPSPYTTQAQNLTAQRALDPNSLISQSQGLLGNTIAGKYLTPDSNPYLRASVEDALGLAGSAYAKQYGGPAGQNLNNTGYQEGLARGLGAAATNAYSNAYQGERQNQLNAMQLAPSLDYANISPLAGIGAQEESRAQSQYDSPWNNLAQYQQLIAGQGGGTTTGQQPYYSNPLANALGLGIGGLALYNGLGAAGLFGGGGGAAAAGLTGAGDIFGTLGPLALV